MRTPPARLFRNLLLAAAFALTGCEDAEQTPGVSWNGASKPKATTTQTASSSSSSTTSSSSGTSSSSSSSTAASKPASSSSSTSSSTQATAQTTQASTAATRSAAVPAAAATGFNWTFGGVDGSGAAESGVRIAGLRFSSDGLSFSYQQNLSAWGLGYTTAGAYACLFVKRSDGRWVGGKFDWISSSRTSRHFENVFSGYGGWSLSGVPNPCQAAFLILSRDKKKRSNILYGTWKR